MQTVQCEETLGEKSCSTRNIASRNLFAKSSVEQDTLDLSGLLLSVKIFRGGGFVCDISARAGQQSNGGSVLHRAAVKWKAMA